MFKAILVLRGRKDHEDRKVQPGLLELVEQQVLRGLQAGQELQVEPVLAVELEWQVIPDQAGLWVIKVIKATQVIKALKVLQAEQLFRLVHLV